MVTEKKYLFYDLNGKSELHIERSGEMNLIGIGVSIDQALNIAKVFSRKYGKIIFEDCEYEARLYFSGDSEEISIDTRYPEDEKAVYKKYSIKYEEIDETDLEAEKWNNYYGDFNQCGIIIQSN